MSAAALNLNSTYGCVLIGVLLAAVLYGISCAQVTYYFRVYPKDSTAVKAMVAMLWVIDTCRTTMAIMFLWSFAIWGHANLVALSKFSPGYLAAEFMLSSTSIMIVQLFYVKSIWLFLLYKWYRSPLAITMVFLTLLSFASGIANVVSFTQTSVIRDAIWDARVPASVQHISTIITDAYISLSLSWTLSKNKTGFGGTDSTITKLVMFGITRGICTALTQLFQFITFWLDLSKNPPQLVWTVFHFVDGAVYTNSMMALLNLRQNIVEGMHQDEGCSFDIPLHTWAAESTAAARTQRDIDEHHRMH